MYPGNYLKMCLHIFSCESLLCDRYATGDGGEEEEEWRIKTDRLLRGLAHRRVGGALLMAIIAFSAAPFGLMLPYASGSSGLPPGVSQVVCAHGTVIPLLLLPMVFAHLTDLATT